MAAGMPFACGRKHTGGLSESLPFASVALQCLEGKEKGSWKRPAPLRFRELPRQHPVSSRKDCPACNFLAFPWVSICEGTLGSTDSGCLSQGACCVLLPAIKTHSPVFPELLVLLISLWGGMLRRAREGLA